MPRLLWLAFAAAVAALLFACLLEWLFPKSAIPARWVEDEDGLPPFDPEVWARAQQAQSSTVVMPFQPPTFDSAVWYVASCGFAHPLGVCSGHDPYIVTGGTA